MYRNFLKRIFDIIISIAFLPIFILLAIPIAIFIKLESKGPVFFKQKRAGKNGTYFEILKFRSMSSSPDDEKKEFEPGEKKRITKVGAILRKTKLDEIPQIINVIKGEMSIVGPRPEVKKYVDVYPEECEKILSIKPGITDPASVKFRNEEELLSKSSDPEREYKENILPKKLKLYEEYISNITFINDLKIIFKTIFTVFFK
ncbi:MAG TPA: sugar transferase [Victivallales bacterium]|nr:sugar transferase [Victivallales bacterium]